jgi:hypothetical protein
LTCSNFIFFGKNIYICFSTACVDIYTCYTLIDIFPSLLNMININEVKLTLEPRNCKIPKYCMQCLNHVYVRYTLTGHPSCLYENMPFPSSSFTAYIYIYIIRIIRVRAKGNAMRRKVRLRCNNSNFLCFQKTKNKGTTIKNYI